MCPCVGVHKRTLLRSFSLLLKQCPENSFIHTDARNWQYSIKTITDADCADDQVLLENIPAQAKFVLHSMDQAVRSIGLYLNSDKTELMCFNIISSLNDKPLKLVDQFITLGSNISSTENNIHIHIDCDGHAQKCPRTTCVCFSRAHIRRRHYRMITKKHLLDWLVHPTRVQLADKNNLGYKIR